PSLRSSLPSPYLLHSVDPPPFSSPTLFRAPRHPRIESPPLLYLRAEHGGFFERDSSELHGVCDRGKRMSLAQKIRRVQRGGIEVDRKSTRLNSSHGSSSYAVFCLKKKIQ